MANNPSNKIKSESIDEVILRLLGLNSGIELDYQTYFNIIKKKLSIARLGGKELPQEEDELLREELKRVRKITDKGLRFKVKKTKTKVSAVSSPEIKKSTSNQKLKNKSVAIVKSGKGAISYSDTKPVDIESDKEKTNKRKDNFSSIGKTLNSILKILGSKFKFDQKQSDKERQEKETEKRGKRESTLEGFKKGVAGIVSVTKKMLSPFQAIIDRIWRFIFFTLLGRAFTKFMEWMSDKGNQEKFNAFIDFLTDHWPALAGLYILFGTSFGKLVRGLLKGAARMIVALAMNVGKIKKFISKNKKLAFLGLAIAPLASRELGNIFGENKETPESGLIPREGADLKDAKADVDKIKETPAPRMPAASVGGIIPKLNMGGLIPSFIGGGMDFQQGVPISGAGKDDTLIAAKTGEAILTEKDQQDIAQRYVDKETGQPLSIPQYLSGRKPGSVGMGNIRFPGFGGGFNLGGMIPKFQNGGIIGAVSGLFNKSSVKSTEKMGPQITPNIVNASLKRQPGNLTTSANSLMKENWSYASRGGDAKNGCAPAINEVYKRAGISVPWGSVMRPNYVPDIQSFLSKKFVTVSEKQRKPGDIVIWQDTGEPPGSMKDPYGHIGIVMPDGKIANNSTSKGTFTNLNTPQEAKSWWPNTQALIYYRDPRVNKVLTKSNSRSSSQKPKDKNGRTENSGSFGIFGSLLNNLNIKKQKGGLIGESTGTNMPGATADRQLTALQPGEYVLPVDTVNRLGTSLIDKLVAMTDSNSNAYLKKGSTKRPQITPYNSFGSGMGMDGMITLPPIISSQQGTRARSAGLAGGSEVPTFSAIAPNNDRASNASIYGLVG